MQRQSVAAGAATAALLASASAAVVIASGPAFRPTAGVLHGPLLAARWSGASFLFVLAVGIAGGKQTASPLRCLAALAALCASVIAGAVVPVAPLVTAVAAAVASAAWAASGGVASSFGAAVAFAAVLFGGPVPDELVAGVGRALICAVTVAAFANNADHLACANALRNALAWRSKRKNRKRLPPKRGKTHQQTPDGSMRTSTALLIGTAGLLCGGLVLPTIGRFAARILLRWPLPAGTVLLAHAKGPTGRISVLEEAKRGVRLLLSDHSILGGIYVAEGYERETVFNQFHVHEAVRLTRTAGDDEAAKGGREGRALCLGLGVGVVAQALHDLGSSVDAVELDPVVARFAEQYFGLKGPRVHVGDASEFVNHAKETSIEKYDYVVHDVFTGGSVPLRMFALETFRSVRAVMKDDGVLAVNFVGVLEGRGDAWRAVAAVQARLQAVFNFVSAYAEDNGSPVHNIVFFASDVQERMRFRKPVERDFLGSSIRMETLHEFNEKLLNSSRLPSIPIEEATDQQIDAGRWVTAEEHWIGMRNVLERRVWYALAAAEETG